MRVDSSGRQYFTFAGYNVCARPDNQIRIHPVHRIRVPGLPDADDVAFFDTDIRLEDTTPVNDKGVRDHQVEALRISSSARLANSIAQRLASAESALVAVAGQILFDPHPQIGRRKADYVANRGSIHRSVRLSVHGTGFDMLVFPGRIFRRVVELLLFQTTKNRVRHGEIDSAGRDAASTSDGLEASDLHQGYSFRVSRLEADRCAGRNVEVTTVRLQAVEIQVRVRLDEVEMRADLLSVSMLQPLRQNLVELS